MYNNISYNKYLRVKSFYLTIFYLFFFNSFFFAAPLRVGFNIKSIKEKTPPRVRSCYIQEANKYFSLKWEPIDTILFGEYKKNGNRTNFERYSFVKRNHLSCLVLGEMMEGKGRYLPEIIKGIKSICEEPWWGVPAHYPKSYPDYNLQVVDLFNSETASMLAWTKYILYKKIDSLDHGIIKKIDNEIQYRFLKPVLSTDYEWKHSDSNWNTWITSNWLACVLLCEDDPIKQRVAVSQIKNCLLDFYNNYPNDGGCSEGTNYWFSATGTFVYCLYLLEQSGFGCMIKKDNPKFQNMVNFISKMYIGKGYKVNYADSAPKMSNMSLLLYPIGFYLNNKAILGIANSIYNDDEYNNPSPCLGKELFMLNYLDQIINDKSELIVDRDIWMPDIQVMIARSEPNKNKGLILSVKGGNNAENHNHNDVGSFIVYADGMPLIIDLGQGTYSASTSSDLRYNHVNYRSKYHNIPIINGCEQNAGEQYKATDVVYRTTGNTARFSMDIAAAYPKEAKVKKWNRSITFYRKGGIRVEEKYSLFEFKDTSAIILMSCIKPKIKNGTIFLGDHKIKFSQNKFDVCAERVWLSDKLLFSRWDGHVWRIVMKIKDTSPSNCVSYEFYKQ